MSDLAELYRRAPRLDSPDRLDTNVLNRARLNAPVKQRAGWQLWLPAVSMACVGVLGLTMVLRQGVPPLSDTRIEPSEQTDATEPLAQVDLAELAEPVGQAPLVTIEQAPLVSTEPAPVVNIEQAPMVSTDQAMSADSAELLPELVADDVAVALAEESVPAPPPATVVQQKRRVESVAVTAESAGAVPQNNKLQTQSRLSVAESQLKAAPSVTKSMAVAPAGENSGPAVSEWLAGQPDHYFTVTVANAANRSVLEKLAAQNGLKPLLPDTVIVKSDRFGWVYISGSFNTRDAAAKRLQQLKFSSDADIVTFKTLKSESL
jgi:hypothetical protein